MPKTLRGKTTKTTVELRDAIIDAYFVQDQKISEIARKHNMAKSAISDIVKRYREGRVAYKYQEGAKNVKTKGHHSDFLRDLIGNEEDGNILALDQLKFQLEQNFQDDFTNEKAVSIEATRRHVDQNLELTLKRARAVKERQLDDNTIQKRKKYTSKVSTGSINYMDNCIFVDESGFNACMVPERARSKRDKRSHIMTKIKRSLNISIISALNSTAVGSLETRMLPKGANVVILDENLENIFQKL